MDKTNDVHWHNSRLLRRAVLNFHNEITRYPQEAIKEGMKTLEHHINPIRTKLKKTRFISRLEYTGSVWEGVKIGTSTLEFDLMFVLCGFDNVLPQPIPGRPGYFTLSVVRDDDSTQDIGCYLGRNSRSCSDLSKLQCPEDAMQRCAFKALLFF